MMSQFAKTFDVGDHQLLVYIEFDVDRDDDDSDQHVIHQIFQAPIGMVDISLKLPEAPARNIFEAFTQIEAEILLQGPMVLKIMAVGADEPTQKELR